jgi:hypothetical protein
MVCNAWHLALLQYLKWAHICEGCVLWLLHILLREQVATTCPHVHCHKVISSPLRPSGLSC